MGLLSFAIKSSIVGGVAYYTVQEGLWGTPEQSAAAYNKLYNNVSPLVQKNVPKEVVEEIHRLPNPSDFKRCVVYHWNNGVQTSIKFLSELPEHVSNGITQIQKNLEQSNLSTGEPTKSKE